MYQYGRCNRGQAFWSLQGGWSLLGGVANRGFTVGGVEKEGEIVIIELSVLFPTNCSPLTSAMTSTWKRYSSPLSNHDRVLSAWYSHTHFTSLPCSALVHSNQSYVVQFPLLRTPKEHEKTQVPTQCLSLTRTDNLAKTLVRAKLKQYPNPPKSTTPITIKFSESNTSNSIPCQTPGCKCCKAISKKCRVTSSHDNKTYPTQRYTSCATRNVIYLLEFTKCTKGNQYVSQTSRPVRIRQQT